jgi:hypothetical protein
MTARDDVDSVTSREGFLSFAEALLAEYQAGAAERENVTTDRFLEALLAYARDATLPAEPSWRTLASLLRAGTVYECGPDLPTDDAPPPARRGERRVAPGSTRSHNQRPACSAHADRLGRTAYRRPVRAWAADATGDRDTTACGCQGREEIEHA